MGAPFLCGAPRLLIKLNWIELNFRLYSNLAVALGWSVVTCSCSVTCVHVSCVRCNYWVFRLCCVILLFNVFALVTVLFVFAVICNRRWMVCFVYVTCAGSVCFYDGFVLWLVNLYWFSYIYFALTDLFIVSSPCFVSWWVAGIPWLMVDLMGYGCALPLWSPSIINKIELNWTRIRNRERRQ